MISFPINDAILKQISLTYIPYPRLNGLVKHTLTAAHTPFSLYMGVTPPPHIP